LHVVMAIALRVLSGFSAEPLCTAAATRGWTAKDVKAAIEELEGTARPGQRLFIHGEAFCEGGRTLGDVLKTVGKKVSATGSQQLDVFLVKVEPVWAAMLQNVEDGWMELRDVAEQFQHDREVVLAAMRAKGTQLRDAAEEFRRDREVVMAAVSSNGSALRFAADSLKRDQEVVLTAIRGSDLALRSAAEELWHNRDFLLAVVQEYGSALMYAPMELRRDRDVVLAAVCNDVTALRHAPPEMWHEPEIRRVALEACAELWPEAAHAAQDRCQLACSRQQRRARGARMSEDALLAAVLA